MPKDLRIIYMGTPDFAVPSLKILVKNSYNVVAVVTAPDKPAGRGLKLKASPVKEYAESVNIPILQPVSLKDPAFLDELKSYNANLQIVVAFRMLPESVWNMPEIGTFNLHASLLPQYRGAAPINWAIINGETETGITTFFLKHEIDTGDIIFQEKEIIYTEDNFETLYGRLMNLGAELVLNTVHAIKNDAVVPKPQMMSQELKPAPKISKETGRIDWSKSSINIANLIRGLSPIPSAWTILNDKVLKIYKASIVNALNVKNPEQKSFLSDNKTYLYFRTGNGYLSLEEVQLEGKKRMMIDEFLRGYKPC
ncbi:methionyl-tRNA formyltransferase [Sporocytophaga myxococcoides]|nr:methionyl-tRNA formyltransferase [Sporocytophaga myxococcoides]